MDVTHKLISKDLLIRRSNFTIISRHHFDIERKAYKVATCDNEMPKIINEAIISYVLEHWIKGIEEEIELIRVNRV